MNNFCRLFYVILISFLSSCSEKEPLQPTILCTIAPYSGISKELSKETKVVTLIPPGVDLHTYEPLLRDLDSLGKPVLWIQIGDPIEDLLGKAIHAHYGDISILNVSDFLPEKEKSHSHCCHFHGVDTHGWLSPLLLKKQVSVIAKRLRQVIPGIDNSKQELEISTTLNELHERGVANLQKYRYKHLLVTHSAFGYFCNEFDLFQAPIESEGKLPSPQDFDALHTSPSKYIPLILAQKGYSTKPAQKLSSALNFPIVSISPVTEDYIQNIESVIQAIETVK